MMNKRPEEITAKDLAAGERKQHPHGCPLCGYSFRGLGASPVCPECRYPECLTCSPGQRLRNADNSWLRGVHRGLLLQRAAGLSFVATWVGFLLVAMANRSTLPSVASFISILVLVITVASAGCGLVAACLISKPDPSGVFLGNTTTARRLLLPLSALGLLSLAAFVVLAHVADAQFGRLPSVLASVIVIALCGSALMLLVRHARRLHWQTSSWTLDAAQVHKNTLDWVQLLIGGAAVIDVLLAVLPYFRGTPGEGEGSNSGCAVLGFPVLWACLGFGGVRAAIAGEIDPASIPPAKPEFGDMPDAAKPAREERKPPG